MELRLRRFLLSLPIVPQRHIVMYKRPYFTGIVFVGRSWIPSDKTHVGHSNMKQLKEGQYDAVKEYCIRK